MRRSAFVAVAVLLSVLFAAPADAAKKRPRNQTDVDYCRVDSGADQGCEGAICWCCYSDGCWICNNLSAPGDADCVWDPGKKGRLQGTTALGTAGQTLAPLEQGTGDGQSTDNGRGTAILQPQLFESQGALSTGGQLDATQPKLHILQPLTILQAPPLECWTVSNTYNAETRVHIRNTTGQDIPRDQRISWITGSIEDTMKLARPFEAGRSMRVGPPYAFAAANSTGQGCRAWIGPPRPVLAQ